MATSPARGSFSCLAGAVARLFAQKWKPNSAVYARGVTKCVPLNVDRKLYTAVLLVRLMTVKRKLHLYRSPWKRLSSPTDTSNRLRGLTRVGLRSRLNVGPAILSSFAPLLVGLGPQLVGVRAVVNVALCVIPAASTQKSPIAVCWSASRKPDASAKLSRLGLLATNPLSYRQLKATQGNFSHG